MLANFGWVLIGNLIGSVAYALLFYGALTMFGHANDASGIAAKIAAIGNFIGGSVFTGFALYLTYGQKKEANPATIAPSAIAEPGPVS
jgi:formate/nitrite transporter FocA (FNT family)